MVVGREDGSIFFRDADPEVTHAPVDRLTSITRHTEATLSELKWV